MDAVSALSSVVAPTLALLGMGTLLAKITTAIGIAIPAVPAFTSWAADRSREELLEIAKQGERFSTTAAAILGWLAFVLWLPANMDGCVAYRTGADTRVACPAGYLWYLAPPSYGSPFSVHLPGPTNLRPGTGVICTTQGPSFSLTPSAGKTTFGTVVVNGQASDCQNVLHLTMGGTIGVLHVRSQFGGDDLTADASALVGTVVGVLVLRSPKPPEEDDESAGETERVAGSPPKPSAPTVDRAGAERQATPNEGQSETPQPNRNTR
jgi:hypothetical protein